jgi:hypothetical protein
MAGEPKKVFISYSSKDQAAANQVRNALINMGLEVWLDTYALQPGDHVASQITKGLNQSSYFIILISENSNSSQWVKREIDLAFALARDKNLSVIPIVLGNAEVPLEFRGLLYIDASRSLPDGLRRLQEFFASQTSLVKVLEERSVVRKAGDNATMRWHECQTRLRDLELSDLRYQLSSRLTLNDVKVLWFDVFSTKMDDDVQVHNVALCCVELLDRSRREDALVKLIDKVCRNHPRICT